MSKLEKSSKFRPFRPWKLTFRAIQSNPALAELISTILGKVHAKIEKKLLTSFLRKCYWPVFWENGVKCKKGQIWTVWPVIMTFRAIQPNPSYDMLLMSSQTSFMPKMRKSYWSVFEISCPFPHLKLTTPTTTTDESAFEKLRCQMAQRS